MIVVSITPEASAGSMLNLFNVSGIKVPANPAMIRFKIMAKAITNPSKVSSNQYADNKPIIKAKIKPLIPPTKVS